MKPLDAAQMERFLIHLVSCEGTRVTALGRRLTAPELLWCYAQFLIDMGYGDGDRREVVQFARRVIRVALSERKVVVAGFRRLPRRKTS